MYIYYIHYYFDFQYIFSIFNHIFLQNQKIFINKNSLSNKDNYAKIKEQIDINIVAKRTFEIRKDMNESLREFAKRLNTSGSTWHAYEKGKVLILGAFLIEVCKNYNYSADWILGRTNDKFIH